MASACAIPSLSVYAERGFGTIERASGGGGHYDTNETVLGVSMTWSASPRAQSLVGGTQPPAPTINGNGDDSGGRDVGNDVTVVVGGIGLADADPNMDPPAHTPGHDEGTPYGPDLPPSTPWWGSLIAKVIYGIGGTLVAAFWAWMELKGFRRKASNGDGQAAATPQEEADA